MTADRFLPSNPQVAQVKLKLLKQNKETTKQFIFLGRRPPSQIHYQHNLALPFPLAP